MIKNETGQPAATAQRPQLSRVVLAHAPRQPVSWLTWDVGQRMLLDTLHAEQAIASAVHLAVRSQTFTDIDHAAREFGLRPLGDKWRSVDRDTAVRVLFALLIADMAFSTPRMSEEEARTVCDEFLSQFGADSRFFTNGNWEDGWTKSEGKGASFGPLWAPATDATFDGGVIVLGQSSSGVLWLEDED